MTQNERQAESLHRARSGESYVNYGAIIDGFIAKGIPAVEISPRENVFTFNAWKALGRTVRKGEHGVKITTVRETVKEDKDTGEKRVTRYPWHTTVFHVSQTEPIGVTR